MTFRQRIGQTETGSQTHDKGGSQSQIPRLMVSVDPGANGGWVLWVDGNFREYGIMDGDKIHHIFRLIHGLTGQYASQESWGSDDAKNTEKSEEKESSQPVLVIEDQYVGNNWATGKTLITRRVRWQAIAELHNWKIELVNPSRWQSKILKKVPGETTKEKSIFLATDIVGKVPQTSDIADAICIGRYWIDFLKTPKELQQLLFENKAKKRRKSSKKQGKKEK